MRSSSRASGSRRRSGDALIPRRLSGRRQSSPKPSSTLVSPAWHAYMPKPPSTESLVCCLDCRLLSPFFLAWTHLDHLCHVLGIRSCCCACTTRIVQNKQYRPLMQILQCFITLHSNSDFTMIIVPFLHVTLLLLALLLLLVDPLPHVDALAFLLKTRIALRVVHQMRRLLIARVVNHAHAVDMFSIGELLHGLGRFARTALDLREPSRYLRSGSQKCRLAEQRRPSSHGVALYAAQSFSRAVLPASP